MRRRSLAGSLALVFTLVAVGCNGDQPGDAPPPPTAQPATPGAGPGAPSAPLGDQAEQGRQIFAGAGICFTCHGPAGQGTALGPNLADGQWVWVDPSEPDFQNQLVEIMRAGVPQPREYPAPMPPMGGVSLTDEQLESLAVYLISLNS